MRLGFYYHAPAVSRDGSIHMPGYQGRFIDALAALCERVVCLLHAPHPHEISRMDYRIQSDNVVLVDLGVRSSAVARSVFPGAYTSFLRRHSKDMDILLVRGPSPLLPAMVRAAGVPTALLLVGDYVTGVDDLPQPRWRKEAIRLWSYWNRWEQGRAARKSLTFVNSRVLYGGLQGRIPDLHEIRTTTLTKVDFYSRPDTCAGPPYRLLYVGRMDRSKGLLQMAEAVRLLTEQGEDVVLELVGWPELGDHVLDEISAFSIANGLEDRIRYLGPRPLGPQLSECYRRADVFVIASLASEGFPRVIWEAMANSVPVVATRVGSIPALLDGAAELIEPRSSSALAGAVRGVIHDTSRRQGYIRRGRKLAQGNTLEASAAEMLDVMQSYQSAVENGNAAIQKD